ncbi:hypothetical protein CQW23_11839 [Capsicum baccatum]|uniref:Uncharacterized protein n=1 Tax=Capsicum baccatum TaxID=33114 RepID=A0A2G2WR07_CAPBA|nr:hypothetical protein CQW23_11839 [Capsicum baccatum]
MLRGLIDFAAEPIPTRSCPLPVFKNSVFSLPLRYHIHGYYEDAQEDCCREEYDKGKKVMSSSRGLENECSGSKLHAPTKVFQSFVPPKYCGKFLGGHSISREKEVQTGKQDTDLLKKLLVYHQAPSG